MFEFVERTILEDLENSPDGVEPESVKAIMYQLLRAIAFCHTHNVIHRVRARRRPRWRRVCACVSRRVWFACSCRFRIVIFVHDAHNDAHSIVALRVCFVVGLCLYMLTCWFAFAKCVCVCVCVCGGGGGGGRFIVGGGTNF